MQYDKIKPKVDPTEKGGEKNADTKDMLMKMIMENNSALEQKYYALVNTYEPERVAQMEKKSKRTTKQEILSRNASNTSLPDSDHNLIN